MPLRGRASLLLALLQAAALTAACSAAPVKPLPQAHAHNDYEHARPLQDALNRGFCSVEADVHLVDGQLLVAHDRPDARPERTLESLYLRPLQERVKRNGGRVYPEGPSFTLLVDVKSDAAATYPVLRDALRPYAAMLTEFRPDRTDPRAVTVILSGNRPRAELERERTRFMAMDGRLSDLGTGASPHLIPLISDNWTRHFTWTGAGAMPETERKRLRQIVEQAHRAGQQVRFWATPDTPAMWGALRDARVDLINTDDLDGLRKFLLTEPPASAHSR